MRDTPQVQAVWPFDTRDDGRIVRMLDGRCYRYVATVPEIPDAATREYVFDNIGGFVDECGDPSCVNDDCVQVPGGVIEIGSPCSIDTTIYDCVDSFNYTYSESGFGRLTLDPNSPFIEYAIYAGSSFSGSWSLSAGGTGTWDVYTRGTRENGAPWDYSESYQVPTSYIGSVSPEPAARAFVQNPGTLPPEVYSTSTDGVGQNPGNTGHNGTIDGATFCQQGVRRETTTSGGGTTTTRTSIVRISGGAFRQTVYAFWSIRSVDSSGAVTRLAYNRLVRRFAFSGVRFSSGIELPDLTTEDQCEIPSTVIAYRCDAEDPNDPEMQIVVDLAEVPDPGSLQYRCWYEGHLYIVTGELAEGEAAEVVWTLDQCPEPPDPTGDVYRINICNSTTRAGGGVVEGGVLVPKVIGYRPGDGLAPGEGMVWANIPVATNSGNVCLRRVACQPTTQVVTDAEIEYTSIAGNCRGQPVANADPRPGCSQVDGGGGVQPSDTLGINAPQDPALQAEIDRQSAMRTGQFPGRCPSCGG